MDLTSPSPSQHLNRSFTGFVQTYSPLFLFFLIPSFHHPSSWAHAIPPSPEEIAAAVVTQAGLGGLATTLNAMKAIQRLNPRQTTTGGGDFLKVGSLSRSKMRTQLEKATKDIQKTATPDTAAVTAKFEKVERRPVFQFYFLSFQGIWGSASTLVMIIFLQLPSMEAQGVLLFYQSQSDHLLHLW